MATREALQIEQQQNQKTLVERLERIEAKLDELLLMLIPDATTDSGAATFGDEPDHETVDDGAYGGFMDVEETIGTSRKRKSRNL